MAKEELPMERPLGGNWKNWNVEKDTLYFGVNLKEKPRTRREMLSMLSSFYNSLGLASSLILKGRLIQQDLCKEE